MHILIAALHRPTKPTGVCRYAANLVQCLSEHELVEQVSFVAGTWQKGYFEHSFNLSSTKVKAVYIPIQNTSLSRNLWFLFGLPKLARSLNPSIVHLSFPLPFFRTLFAMPVVATIHDLYPFEYPENFGSQAIFNQLFLRQCVHQSDGLTCVSQVTSDRLNFYFPQLNRQKLITEIYNYVDFDQIAPQPLQSSDLSADTPFLLCVAQHRKNKNLDLLIQAFYQLRQDNTLHPSSQLVLVGSSGPETDNLAAQIDRLGLKDHVLMLSAIDDRQLCWLYQQAKLFVIPSSTEGFCLPLVEALSLSCPVVCSDIPIFREVGSSQCTYFSLEATPVENLVRAIATTLKASNAAAPIASQTFRFSKANAAQNVLEFYSKVIS